MDISQFVLCTDASQDFHGIFDFSIAPHLLYYSYIPIIFVALLVGLFILIKDKFSLISETLFTITLLFSLFIINEFIQWVAIPIGIVYFSWSLGVLLNFLIVITTIYFVYLFVVKKDLPFSRKMLLTLVTLPVILLLPTRINLTSFDPDWCGAITGPLWYYLYTFEVTTGMVFLIHGIRFYRIFRRNRHTDLLPSIVLLFGTSFFLLIFFASYFFADFTGVYGVNLIGPLGMIVFVLALSLLIVKFKSFNTKTIATEALTVAQFVLIASMFAFTDTLANRILVGSTLLITTTVGYFLIKSVKKEVFQREQIAKLAANLEKANERLKALDMQKSEFVSIASHQLRSPLTSIRGYASMLLEGSYGKVPQKAVEPLQRIEKSSRLMATAVEDYLNVSRIESGNMKYNLSDFNLRDEVEHICDDLRPEALKRGLVLLFRTDLNSRGVVNADIGKTVQAVQNLITNSIKYTEKGTIKVLVRDNVVKKIIYVDVEDTGIGMSHQTLQTIFQKFERADNANSVNVNGTGLGLYVALKMVEAMGGCITAYSEGDGQGSRFTLELPLAM